MDEKRIELVRNGDEEAVIKTIKEFELMIYSIISSYELNYGDYIISKEDLFQEGCIALIEACKCYKPTNNTKFSTFAYVVIERRIQRVFFKMLKPYRKEYSFDKYNQQDRINKFGNSMVCDSGNENQIDIDLLLEEIRFSNEEDKKIIELRLQNYSYKEIAKLLNISTKKVDNRIARLKKMNKKK